MSDDTKTVEPSAADTSTEPMASANTTPFTPAEMDEMRQLAALFVEMKRELGETDDPDLQFAAAFARQSALGNLSQ